ncbi:MAG: glycerol-3-phosphate responsive antiterminator [Clostridia bacterium]|nr:glycerol-3-phosphate responsive antiterminator [Clostridia bacterium]
MNVITESLKDYPIIAAVKDDKFAAALTSPANVVFYLSADLLTVQERIRAAHDAGKLLLVHLDLAEGIGKDASGVKFLKQCGVDGIISTRANLIRAARESGLFAVQRFFALDSQGVQSIDGILENCRPNMIEVMPGVVYKVIERLNRKGHSVIAGGLLETKTDVTDALKAGAFAISTGKTDLWSV